MKTIRVYGRTAGDTTFQVALERKLGRVRLVAGDYEQDAPLNEAIISTDLLLCFITQENAEAAHTFLSRVISSYGAWNFLPSLVIGEPDELDLQQRLFRLGATLYLPGGLENDLLAEHAQHALTQTWWHQESRSTLPAFLVDVGGVILRANAAAEHRFGGNLFGQPYSQAVENSSKGWSAAHPIALALAGEGRIVDSDHKFHRDNGDEGRYFLSCRPLHVLADGPRFAAVLVRDTGRWEKLVNASGTFRQAVDRKELYDLIVSLGEELGFARVRLYEATEGGTILKGRASRGYSENKAAWFREDFKIHVREDAPSQETMARSKGPLLWIRRDEFPGLAQAIPETDSNIRFYIGKPNYAEELGKEGVRRWIEAPIWWQPDGKDSPRVVWGKLSIDPGPDSDLLEERDVGHVALYARLAGDALASFRRREVQRDIEKAVQEISRALVVHVDPEGAPTPLLPIMLKPLLSLYQRLTGAEVVLYRHYDEGSLSPLRLTSTPVFASEDLAEQMSVPRDVPQSADLGAVFQFANKDRNRSDNVEPYVVPNPQERVRQLFESAKDALSPTEVNYLNWIRSEIHIPLSIESKPFGVLIAVSGREGAFSSYLAQQLGQFTDRVSVGVELARRHDSQQWIEETFHNAARVLPLLADAESDEAFFGGLATLLSAHNGLRWNRVFLYNCVGQPSGTAELVYALGGLAGDANQRRHLDLLRAVATDSKYEVLENLVQARLSNPNPEYVGPDGQRYTDELYTKVRGLGRVVEHFGSDVASTLPVVPGFPHSKDDDTNNHLANILGKAASTQPIPTTFNDRKGERCRWVDQMNSRSPDLFSQGNRLYAFPLICLHNQSQEPLGLVLVDMPHHNDLAIKDICLATWSLLCLVADIFALRTYKRRIRGQHKYLHAVMHERNLEVVYNSLTHHLPELRQGLVRLASSAPDEQGLTGDQLDAAWDAAWKVIKPASAKIRHIAGLFAELLAKVEKVTDPAIKPLSDLGQCIESFVDDYRQRYPELQIDCRCDAIKLVPLECDEIVLKDVLNGLFQNSREAKATTVTISASVVSCPGKRVDRVVEIAVVDNGVGIEDMDRPYLFIDGYTRSGDPNKGAGLSVIKTMLSAFRGVIELGPTPEMGGANFAIRFGLFPRNGIE